MTTTDVKNAKAEIEAKYFELGGKPELLAEFFNTLLQAADFGLIEEYVTAPAGLVNQFFKPRHAGRAEKFDIREVVGKRANPDGGKTYSILDKKYI